MAPSTFQRLSSVRYVEEPFLDWPLPLSLVRKAKQKDIIEVVLTSEIKNGPADCAHAGQLRMPTAMGVLELDIAVKLAWTTDEKQDLKKEYHNYSQLMSKGLQGLTTIFGIYGDVASGPQMLLFEQPGSILSPTTVISGADHR